MATPAPHVDLVVMSSPTPELAMTNDVHVHPAVYEHFPTSSAGSKHVAVGKFVFRLRPSDAVPQNSIALNSLQRKAGMLALSKPFPLVPFSPEGADYTAAKIQLQVDFAGRAPRGAPPIDGTQLEETIRQTFSGQFFATDQTIVHEFYGTTLLLTVGSIEVFTGGSVGGETSETESASLGMLFRPTVIGLQRAGGSEIRLENVKITSSARLLKPSFDMKKLGIGGLDKEFEDIFRRAFVSRMFPGNVAERMGIPHVKGVLLYGPPGTGKTLTARQIGKMLNAKEPKIVNGPEIFNKYVGQSEENIRNLFKDAEDEYAERGEDSDLHVIVFDEIDAICKQRGGQRDNTGVHDTVVNQLLSKIDGVDAINNVLVIGMTNRKDLIDEAMLRPGRFEVHIQIGLPDEKGRRQIFEIHTARLREHGYLGNDVDLDELAATTKNYSGAEIAGVVKSASSFAMNRQVDLEKPELTMNADLISVTHEDFVRAVNEVRPAFGVSEEDFDQYFNVDLVDYGSRYKVLRRSIDKAIRQIRDKDNKPLLSVLLHGPVGTGKSTLAATSALASDFPFVKLISPERLVGMSEFGKCNYVTRVFEDAYKSQISLIVLDNLERLLDYVAMGPRFSNAMLQTLLVLAGKAPPRGKRLLILATTSMPHVLESMGVNAVFNIQLPVEGLSEEEASEVIRQRSVLQGSEVSQAVAMLEPQIGIKKLLLTCDLAAQDAKEGEHVSLEAFSEAVRDCGY